MPRSSPLRNSLAALAISLAACVRPAPGEPKSTPASPPLGAAPVTAPSGDSGPPRPPPATPESLAMPADSYRASLTLSGPAKLQMTAGAAGTVHVTVRNLGDRSFPAKPLDDSGRGAVFLSYHLYPMHGDTPILFDGLRTPLGSDLPPGKACELDMRFDAPKTPGEYRLVPDLVHEGVVWFADYKRSGGFTIVLRVGK